MSGKTITLLAILAFVTLTLGSFIWFIVTWDPNAKESVTQGPTQAFWEESLS
ncbi:MAG: hypothetical protein AAGL92_14540 [Pseudomonadota bacterium]